MSSPPNQTTTTADLGAVVEAIRGGDRFLVTTHENPDGDALGSLLATQLALTALGKDSLMFLPGPAPLPGEYRFLPLDELRRELPDHVAQHLARRRRRRIDEVDVAEPRVVVVVVDVDRERCRVQRRRVGTEPALVRRVHGHERSLGRIVGKLSAQVLERQKPVLAGQRRRPGQEHEAVLAERCQRQLGREQRAERVAVRVLVRGDEKAVGATDRLDDRPEVSLRRRLVRERAHRSVLTSARRARPRDRIRT